MDFDTFKLKAKDAGLSINLVNKSYYQTVSSMVQEDEKIVLGFELYPIKTVGIIGAAVITNENFYGQIPQTDKSFQNVSISRLAIKGILFPEKSIKSFRLETSEGLINLGNILNYKVYT